MPTIAIYNPVCGDQTAKTFFEGHVLPLFANSPTPLSSIWSTERIGHAGELVLNELEKSTDALTVILGSGDGTLHEIINHLSSAELRGARIGASPSKIHLVLVPCGTANALYASLFPPTDADGSSVAYKLRSVMSYLGGVDSHLVPLTLAITTLSPPPTAKAPPKGKPIHCSPVASSVVVSTSLHASILRDSESLRATIPGIERFKVAAKQNSTKWYNSHVKLLPVASLGVVQLYDPDTSSFISHPDADKDEPWPVVDLHGPFAYFLSTVNVDRLEPAFRITPLAKAVPSGATCDLVIVRPFLDPTVSMDTPETREVFAGKLWATLQGAYQDGTHINLRYNAKGEVTTEETEYSSVVEYVRCGGWEWIPDDIDDDAHLVCLDGNITAIEKGGRAVCVAATPESNAGFVVYT
ncbi:hypothetical protein GYMLUDRAFT_162873 [Collybiopsis luxurians FD-317 M1]|uniref:DAGKc domain-containing protein n=1 Tax=Collybiopsis luxurians FD-317 M1 TaxID=944289 RepID=A0A0D0CLH1_9AGAR|nr:hypothetical protein GYMLUDRAFT_162873 [Collybiopsis luxurians FD-317 M1]